MIDELIGWGIASELIVVIVATLPFIELRGALPVAINLFGMPWYWAFCLSIIGNLLPVPQLCLPVNSVRPNNRRGYCYLLMPPRLDRCGYRRHRAQRPCNTRLVESVAHASLSISITTPRRTSPYQQRWVEFIDRGPLPACIGE